MAVLAMSVIHPCSSDEQISRKRPRNDSIRDSPASVRSDQVTIALDEAQPSGKSHLPVVGIPGFSASILGPSATMGVHDCLSLSMAGEAGA